MDVVLVINKGQSEGGKLVLSHFAEKGNQMYFSSYSGPLAPNMTLPQEFYSPLLQKVSKAISDAPVEVFSYDLSAPPHVAEIGLTLFKDFLQTPDDGDRLLEEADRKIKDTFFMLPIGNR